MLAPTGQSLVDFRQELSLRTGHFTKQNRIPFGWQIKQPRLRGGSGGVGGKGGRTRLSRGGL